MTRVDRKRHYLLVVAVRVVLPSKRDVSVPQPIVGASGRTPQPKVNAIVTLVPEMAANAAAKADEMQAHKETLQPLHGLLVAHKDLMETRGIRTTFGLPLHSSLGFCQDWQPGLAAHFLSQKGV